MAGKQLTVREDQHDKFEIILRRRPGMTHEDFVRYHRERHAPLFTSLPEVKQHVRRYVQCHAVEGETLPGLPHSNIDGTTELWFDDLAGLAAVFTAPGHMKKIRPDEQNFLDFYNREFLVGTEYAVIG